MISKTSKFTVFSGPPVVTNSIQVSTCAFDAVRKPTSSGVRFEACQDQFDLVFRNISNETACQASLKDRKIMKVNKDFTLTYGELDTMEPVWKLLNKIDLEYCASVEIHSCEKRRKFYDLGSGSGRPVIAAALALGQQLSKRTDSSPPYECIGIELLPGLFQLSLDAQLEYNKLSCNQDSIICPVQFYLGSIFDLSVCDWTDGDIVFVNSTCFDVSMLLKVYAIAEKLRVGAVVITLSRSLVEIGTLARNIQQQCVSTEKDMDTWQLLFETREVMSWGSADYFVHKKLR